MKRLFTTTLILALILCAIPCIAQLALDNRSVPIQGFSTNPNKCLGHIAANSVLSIGTSGDYNIQGYKIILIYPDVSGIVTYNGDLTGVKVEPIYTGSANAIIISPYVTSIKISVASYVVGM